MAKASKNTKAKIAGKKKPTLAKEKETKVSTECEDQVEINAEQPFKKQKIDTEDTMELKRNQGSPASDTKKSAVKDDEALSTTENNSKGDEEGPTTEATAETPGPTVRPVLFLEETPVPTQTTTSSMNNAATKVDDTKAPSAVEQITPLMTQEDSPTFEDGSEDIDLKMDENEAISQSINGVGKEGIDEEDKGSGEDGEGWDLIKILPAKALTKDPVLCSNEECELPACVVYSSASGTDEKWWYCLDCQQSDFDGWPVELEEYPVKHLEDDHMLAMVKHCSKSGEVEMPLFSATSESLKDDSKSNKMQFRIMFSGTTTQDSKKRTNSGAVTPSPHPVTKVAAKPAKPSKAALAMLANWQTSADAAGGGKIVVEKPEAKKKIFDFLYDAFKPMTITEIYKSLKCEVPQPMLRSCLDDMAAVNEPFEMSDDEDENGESMKKGQAKTNANNKDSGDKYSGSLSIKAGKSANGGLYYVDYNKTKNNGIPDAAESNELAANFSNAETEECLLKTNFQNLSFEADKLFSEPTNEKAAALLSVEEAALEIRRVEVDEARKYKVNEKYKKTVKQGINRMAAEWRKRARLCKDFLINMEEMTDGTISVKKCMKGDGQIYIEADDQVLQNAKEYAEKKQSLSRGGTGNVMENKRRCGGRRPPPNEKTSNGSGLTADVNFIGVSLTSQGTVKREYLQTNN